VNKLARYACIAALAFPLTGMAQVVVRVAPPAPIVETQGPPPYAGAVWIGGYHRWDGGRYVWVPGRWDRPPHPGARWEPGRWDHGHDGYRWREGRWR
jgi:hypothetical protein